MTEEIYRQMRTARQEHWCDYCHNVIKPGQRYEYYIGKYDGDFYVWKAHEACAFIAQEVWDYADPDDEGMDHDAFVEACSDVCRCFVCPDCGKWDTGDEECDSGDGYCLDKMMELFQTKELYREKRDGYGYTHWKLRERKKEPWLKTASSAETPGNAQGGAT